MDDDTNRAGVGADVARRQRWIAVLTRAPVERLARARDALTDPPDIRVLRPPEIGAAMVRARAGGAGGRFNLGEATLTRCAVSVARRDGGSVTGHGYVRGRNKRHAELAALFDALLQDPARHDALERELIGPLEAEQSAIRAETLSRAAASRVDFFTMVRGE